ncbi:MAG: Ppx/GppA phosphatase family protein [Actinomycetota bacterium]|nr:Ppx/GppA phosphatase family protein [Actinomycetota bacterium]
MILAAIDIGTNSTRLLIADYGDGAFKTIEKLTEITRLGEGVDERRVLLKEAMERTAQVVISFAERARLKGASETLVIATSAVRDAKNSKEFKEMILKRSGLKLKVLSGQEEAAAAFSGATSAGGDQEKSLVIDIGGGSTELIFGRRGEAVRAESFDFGSVRLTEMFLKSDPPLESELHAMVDYVNLLAKELFEEAKSWTSYLAIGVAGTITTISSISLKMERYDPSLIDGHVLTQKETERIFKLLSKMPIKERKGLVGLDPKRADIIVAGAAILCELMKGLCLSELVVSERDILDGIIISMSGSILD